MHVHSVTDLVDFLGEVVNQEAGLQDIWVEGEVAGPTTSSQGHCYMTLKDDSARLSCVLFRREYMAAGFEIQAGMTLLVHGRVAVYREQGRVQLILDRAQPSGVGAAYLAFEQLRKRLATEGLFDAGAKRRPPAFPNRVAVVTSASGAALQDVLKVLERRSPRTPVIVAHSGVQGEGAAYQLVRALRAVAARPGVDVLLLVRGGGSIEDLAAFNDEGLARAIRACPVPVIVGVGHETDTTIADFAADLRAPTPSAAAELAVPDVAELRRALTSMRGRLNLAVSRETAVKREHLERARARLARLSPAAQLPVLRQRLDDRSDRLAAALRARLDRSARQLQAGRDRLVALSPMAVLSRGYSLARDEQGRVVTSVATLRRGDRLQTVFSDGTATGELLLVEPAAAGAGH